MPEVKKAEPQKGREGEKGKQKPMMRTVNFTYPGSAHSASIIPGERMSHWQSLDQKTKLAVPNQGEEESLRGGPSAKPCSSHKRKGI